MSKIAVLGPKGTFSDGAYAAFSGGREPMLCDTIPLAMKAAEEGLAAGAFLPIENSLEGTVTVTADLLAVSPLHIQAQYIYEIHHCLMALPGTAESDLREIATHPQPAGQCRRLVEEMGLPVRLTESTAAAAAACGKGEGVIGPRELAEAYGLSILRENVEDGGHNSTRFVLLGKELTLPHKHPRTSLAFSLKDRPGVLYGALRIFAEAGINLRKIESRPSKTVLGEYLFLVDLDGSAADPPIAAALEALGEIAQWKRVLGCYENE